jgi:PTS system nitrogen regulatory IIA component
MNPVGNLLEPGDIRLDVDATTREQVLAEIARMLASRHGMSAEFVLEGLTAREKLGSTGVGHGVAIPHARMTQCSTAAVALVRTRTAIAFDAPDGKPVSLFLGLIVPNKAAELHLQILATAAKMLGDRNFRDKLRECFSSELARKLLVAWPEAPASMLAVASNQNPESR